MEPQSPDPGPARGGTDPRPGGAGFFAWLRGLDITRSSTERWFTGVAGGLARKAGIDPLIVRGIFVVLALLGGPGLLLYLAGWLLLPDEEGKIHAEELVRGRATPGVIVALVIIAVWFIGGVFGAANIFAFRWSLWDAMGLPWWVNTAFSWIFWLAVLAGIGYLIHRAVLHHGRNQRAREAGTGTPAEATFTATSAGETFGSTSGGEGYTDTSTGETVTQRVNAWSAEYAERHEHSKLGAAHVLITSALALIAAGLGAFWVDVAGLAPGDGAWPATGVVAALLGATAVLAVSMIVAGLRGKHSGGVGFLGFLGVVALAVTAVFPAGTSYHLLGDRTITAPAPASFSLFGDTDMDLAIFDARPEQTQVNITQVAGSVDLQLSPTRPAEVTIDVAAGNIDGRGLDGRRQSGVFYRRTISANESAPGPTLHVHVRVLAGNITVTQPELEPR